jgi:hypothetical protein
MFLKKRMKSKSSDTPETAVVASRSTNPFDDNTSIGNLLIKMRAITKEQLLTAIGRKSHHDDMLLGVLLKELGFCNDEQVAAALTLQAKLRAGDAGDAAMTLMEMRLDEYGRGEDRIKEAIEQRKAQQRERGEKSGLWIVPQLIERKA